jgi:hypothetical protein
MGAGSILDDLQKELRKQIDKANRRATNVTTRSQADKSNAQQKKGGKS